MTKPAHRLPFSSVLPAIAAAALMLAQPAARAEDVIKIGAAVSQSGNFAREGEALRDGYLLWMEKVNEAGGIKIGGKPYKLQIVYYDDESQAQTSARLTEKLITEDKVQFLLGPYSSGIANATAAISERYKILTIAPMATANNLYQRGYHYIIGPSALGDTGLDPVLNVAASLSPKPLTMAIVGPDDLFPNVTAEGAKKHAAALGFNVVFTTKYPKGAPDLSSVVTNLKANNPDIVLCTGYTQDSVLLIKTMTELQVKPKLVGLAVAVGVPDFLTSLGPMANGVMGVDYWVETLSYGDNLFKDSEAFEQAFEARFKRRPSYHAAAGAGGGQVLAAAIEKAQSTDSTKVRDAMLEISGHSFYGQYKFAPDGTNSLATLYAAQIIDGVHRVIYPEAVAQAKPIYPMSPR